MKRLIFLPLVLIFVLCAIAIYQYFSFYDNKLHIVFCDVGQGDAIFVKTPGGSTILIDGGPDNAVLHCLEKYEPFWSRKLSFVILTHPHADHLQGLLYVFDRYHVGTFITEDLQNTTFGYRELMSKVQEQKVPTRYVLAGTQIHVGSVVFDIIGPTASFLHTTSPNGIIGENKEFASVETLITFKSFTALLTGDSQADELIDGLQNNKSLSISVLQVPHHGSASGLSREVVQQLRPVLGVISVGKNNRYGHPNPFTLALLREADVPIKRTDQNGDVEIVSDGRDFSTRN